MPPQKRNACFSNSLLHSLNCVASDGQIICLIFFKNMKQYVQVFNNIDTITGHLWFLTLRKCKVKNKYYPAQKYIGLLACLVFPCWSSIGSLCSIPAVASKYHVLLMPQKITSWYCLARWCPILLPQKITSCCCLKRFCPAVASQDVVLLLPS